MFMENIIKMLLVTNIMVNKTFLIGVITYLYSLRMKIIL